MKGGLFSSGAIERKRQFKLFKRGIDGNSAVTSSDFLRTDVPEPFKAEWLGQSGQVIHRKFVVCDFDGKRPLVFCGSSNLAAGGEKSNGDNLITMYNLDVTTRYAVKAIRLHDH